MHPSSARDRELVARARTGERAAFALLIERHYPTLLRSCRRALRDPDLAADAAQQAASPAMLGLDRLRDDDRFGAWLIGIALNVCRSSIRPVARHAASLDTLADRGPTGGVAATTPDPQQNVETAEIAAPRPHR